MFCHNCGAAWPDGTRFCGKCGTNLAGVPTPQVVDEDATVAVHRAPVSQENTVYAPPAPEPIPAPIPEPIPAPIPEPIPEPEPVPAPPIYQERQYQEQYYGQQYAGLLGFVHGIILSLVIPSPLPVHPGRCTGLRCGL